MEKRRKDGKNKISEGKQRKTEKKKKKGGKQRREKMSSFIIKCLHFTRKCNPAVANHINFLFF